MTITAKTNGATLVKDLVVTTAGASYGTLGVLPTDSRAKLVPILNNEEAIVTTFLIVGTMPVNSSLTTYFVRDYKIIGTTTNANLAATVNTTLRVSQAHANMKEADSYFSVVTFVAAGAGTTYSATVFTTTVDTISENYLAVGGDINTMTYTAVAGDASASAAATLAAQLKDVTDTNPTLNQALLMWASSDSAGETSYVITGTLTFSTGAIVSTLVANQAWLIETNATGAIAATLALTAALTVYLNIAIPNKKVIHIPLVVAA